MKHSHIILCLLSAICVLTACNKDEVKRNGIKDGAVTGGVFSVAKDKTVRFSMGNLQYNASSKTYRFALQQYDFVGDANQNISSTYDGYIDLFCWGTGNNPTLASEDSEDYSTFTDWGDKPISNAGNKANQWRTLSNDEWIYLIKSRSNADQLYSTATLTIDKQEFYGLIILPDDWKAPKGLTLDCSDDAEFSSNIYTSSEWSEMEAAGAVFLPAAGLRQAQDVDGADEIGLYWTSTTLDGLIAHTFFFVEEREETQWYTGEVFEPHYTGASVRLVQDK